MLIMGKAKPPEVVETSGGFCSVYPMRRKTSCFRYGDIRRVHRIMQVIEDGQNSNCIN